jgi:hypothetical protein
MTIILGGNVEVRVTGSTVIDAGGDLTTLEEVLAAIDAGIPVRIEIDGTFADGVITAFHVRFETDGVGAVDDEVHAMVAAVDLDARTVTLVDGRAIRIATDALIETDGDFLTLAQVAAALASGLDVRMEADLGPITDGVRDATSAEFESDQADGPDDDDDEIHGIVAAVDLAARTVTLVDGRVFRVASDSAIETDGDFLTLASVADALAAGLEVRVEADLDALGDGIREALEAKFESEQADDDDDDNSGPGNGGHDDDDDLDDDDLDDDDLDDDDLDDDDLDDDDLDDDDLDDDDLDDDDLDDDDLDDDDLDDDELEGVVASVDLAARTVTTISGRVIRVATDALIEADGDILTLEEVATRLAFGAPIRVEAHGAAVGGVFVATTAKFEVDD